MGKHFWPGTMGLVVYCGFLFWLSSIPGGLIPALPLSDKVIHFFLYLGFGLIFAYFAYNLRSALSWVTVGIITFLFTSIYGLSDEIHQIFVPGRSFDSIDLLADIVGGVTGWLTVRLLYKITQRFGRIKVRGRV